MSWQEILRQRLVDRNVRESTHSQIIEQYRRLAQQARLLKARNQTLLRATSAAATKPNLNSSTVIVGEDNPVRTAYIQSLESQVSSLRDEMATVYKTQGQNAQRLLAMNETLREREDTARADAENLRYAKEEITALRRRVDQHGDQMREKDKAIQTMTDELNMLNLEYNQMEEQKAELRKDNATLLQRWLDRMNTEVDRMNDANAWYEDMQTRWHTQDEGKGMRRPSQDSLASSASFVSTGNIPPFPTTAQVGTGDRKGSEVKGGLLLSPNG